MRYRAAPLPEQGANLMKKLITKQVFNLQSNGQKRLSLTNSLRMSILVRQAFIKDINSPHHNKVKDIFIDNGIILQIDDHLNQKADTIVEANGMHLSPGWVDIFVTGTDPGYEFKDTLENISLSASAGGFTHLFVTPNTNPVVQNKATVDYILGKSVSQPVDFHPIGAITKNTEGKELSEMYDMKNGGAIAFGDGIRSVQSSGILIKALQYVSAFNGIIIQLPDDHSIAPHGLMNEGIVSTQIGLPGKPALAEEIMVSRDLALAKYTGSRIHLTGISLATTLEMIRNAKKEGIQVTCSCTPHHLLFTDEDLLKGYDTNLKVNPPLRSTADRSALIEGVKDGTIDCITSHHTPQHTDAKVCEFEYAGFGIIGLESVFGLLQSTGLTEEEILNCISLNPRKIFGLDSTIESGKKADFTVYKTDENYHFLHHHIKSKSSNSPYLGKELKGKVFATVLGDKTNLNVK